MKKLFLLSLVAAMVGTANAAPAKHMVNAGEARVNKAATIMKASPEKTQAMRHAEARVQGLSIQDLGKRNTLQPKAEGDNAFLYYIRPRATFELAFDFSTYRGYSDLAVGPAFYPLTWANKSDADAGHTWQYFDMTGEDVQESTDYDLITTPMFTTVGYQNYCPVLYAGETNVFQDPHMMMWGGDGTIVFNNGSSSKYPVGAFDSWSDSIYLDTYNVGLNCVYYAANYADTYDNLWTEELKEIYSGDADNISNARLEGLLQFMPAPASPYIINNVRWLAYWKSTIGYDLKFSVLKQNEDGSFETIATTSTPLAAQSEFRGAYHLFPLKTQLSGGVEQEGVVIDGPVIFMLHGFHEEGMDEGVTNFLSPIEMMYSDYMEMTQYWDAGSMVSFDYNNNGTTERYTSAETIQGGYYWNYDENIMRDTVVYTSSYPVFFDVEFPFIYSEESEIEMPVAGGDKEVLVMSNQMSELWEVTDENGEFDLPEWITFETVDQQDAELGIFNDSTNVTFTVDPLPDGVEGRQAKILFCYPSFEAPAVVKEFVIKQGTVQDVVAGDVNGDGVCNSADVTALYQFILNNDDSKIVNGDQNGDGTINSADVTAVYKIILGSE